MSYISIDQLKDIIGHSPTGFKPEDVAQRLVNKGHIIQGYNDPTIQGANNVQNASIGGFLGNVFNDVYQTGKAVFQGPVMQAGAMASKAINDIASPFGVTPLPGADAALQEAQQATQRIIPGPIEQAVGMSGEALNNLSGLLGFKLMPGAESATHEGIQKNIALGNFLNGVSKLTELPLGAAERGVNRVTGKEIFSENQKTNPGSPAAMSPQEAGKTAYEAPVSSAAAVSSVMKLLGQAASAFGSRGSPVATPEVNQTAQILGTTPDKLMEVVKSAGSDLTDIESALRKNFGSSYDNALSVAQKAVENGDAPIGALDIADPLRKAVFGDQTTGVPPSSPRFLKTLGDQVQTVSNDINPYAQMAKGANALLNKGKDFAQYLYQQSLKPTKSVIQKFPDVVKTGLSEGVIVSKGGLEKVGTIIDNLDEKIGQAISDSKSKGGVVMPEEVIKSLDETKDFFKNSIGGSKYTQQLDDLANSFRAEHLKDGYTFTDGAFQNADGETVPATEATKPIPVEEAQQLKQNTYATMRKMYGEMKGAEVEGTKALARGLKEEIAKQVPEVSDLNARESKLIGLDKALQDFVRRQGNHNVLGLAGEAGLATGIAENGNMAGGLKVGFLAALAKKAIESPMIKSTLGILLNRTMNAVGPIPTPPAILGPMSAVSNAGAGMSPPRRFKSR